MLENLNFLTYFYTSSITPGPNNLASMSNASRVGLKKALPFNTGIFCGMTLLMLIIAAFCKTLSIYVPAVTSVMKPIGVVYLLWLAWHIYTSGEIKDSDSVKNGFWAGFALQFANPKVMLCGIMTYQIYVIPRFANPVLLALFAVFFAFNCFVITVTWAALGALLKKLFSKYAKITNTIFALLLVYCAVSLYI